MKILEKILGTTIKLLSHHDPIAAIGCAYAAFGPDFKTLILSDFEAKRIHINCYRSFTPLLKYQTCPDYPVFGYTWESKLSKIPENLEYLGTFLAKKDNADPQLAFYFAKEPAKYPHQCSTHLIIATHD